MDNPLTNPLDDLTPDQLKIFQRSLDRVRNEVRAVTAIDDTIARYAHRDWKIKNTAYRTLTKQLCDALKPVGLGPVRLKIDGTPGDETLDLKCVFLTEPEEQQ